MIILSFVKFYIDFLRRKKIKSDSNVFYKYNYIINIGLWKLSVYL